VCKIDIHVHVHVPFHSIVLLEQMLLKPHPTLRSLKRYMYSMRHKKGYTVDLTNYNKEPCHQMAARNCSGEGTQVLIVVSEQLQLMHSRNQQQNPSGSALCLTGLHYLFYMMPRTMWDWSRKTNKAVCICAFNSTLL